MDSGASWLGIVEVGLVFAIVFGWGFNELRQLRRDREGAAKLTRTHTKDSDSHDADH